MGRDCEERGLIVELKVGHQEQSYDGKGKTGL